VNGRIARIVAILMLSLAVAPSARAQTLPIPGSVPVQIDIPRIGTHAAVIPLGLEADGSMSAPTDPDTVGWFAEGTGVGSPGNVLLDGHVDWAGRLRAFGLLRDLQPGDQVQITDVYGNVLTYNVLWAQLYSADAAPVDELFAQTADEEITLVTCGGVFDHSIHMYLSRWVVRAVRAS
jgi:sortase (surface protein transpeptidase)